MLNLIKSMQITQGLDNEAHWNTRLMNGDLLYKHEPQTPTQMRTLFSFFARKRRLLEPPLDITPQILRPLDEIP